MATIRCRATVDRLNRLGELFRLIDKAPDAKLELVLTFPSAGDNLDFDDVDSEVMEWNKLLGEAFREMVDGRAPRWGHPRAASE